jgi:hypothetical protein
MARADTSGGRGASPSIAGEIAPAAEATRRRPVVGETTRARSTRDAALILAGPSGQPMMDASASGVPPRRFTSTTAESRPADQPARAGAERSDQPPRSAPSSSDGRAPGAPTAELPRGNDLQRLATRIEGELDLERLATRVQRRLRQQLAIERERRGWRPWT